MIIIACDHVKLQLIATEDLEQVRHWRNASHVSEHMEFNQEIQPEEQAQWFTELDKRNNLYFKIQVNDVSIGVINLKEIDWKKGVAEAGIFIGNQDYLGGSTPMLAILILMKMAYNCFQLTELLAKISVANTNALKFNQQLGYRYLKELENGFHLYHCRPSNFYSPASSTSNLHQLLLKKVVINIYVDEADEWVLNLMHFDDPMIRLYRI